MDTIKLEIILTDTYGGEANFCWVKKLLIEVPQNATQRAIISRAKKELCINARHKRPSVFGNNSYVLHFYGLAVCMFIDYFEEL